MEILFEDNHLIAVNKPGGMLTHSDKTKDETALDWTKQYIKEKYKKPGLVFLQPVHRIDRPTSGILLFARTSKATTRMTQLFKSRETTKRYLAISNRFPKTLSEASLTNWLKKDGKTNQVEVVKSNVPGAKEAELNYSVTQENDGLFLFDVNPVTGRSHQIRAQLAYVNSPILGDLKYGSKYPTDKISIALHSTFLSFIHPVRKELVEITCLPPNKKWWNQFSYAQ